MPVIEEKSLKIAAIYPYDPSLPSRIRSRDTLMALLAVGDVTVFAPDLDESAQSRLIRLGCKYKTKKDRLIFKLLRVFHAFINIRSISFAYYKPVMPSRSGFESYDLIFSERVIVPSSANAPVVYDIVDDFKSQVKQLAQNSSGLKKVGYFYDSKVIERDIKEGCSAADLVICTTPKEAAALALFACDVKKIKPYLHQSQVEIPELKKRDVIQNAPPFGEKLAVFHGRGSYSANQIAVKYIKDTLVEADIGWSFLVFGEGWKPLRGKRFRTLGFQEDLRLLRLANLAIFPINSAVGVQNKVLEALAAGLPVLVPPELLEGLPPEVVSELSDRIYVANLSEFENRLSSDLKSVVRCDLAERRFHKAYEKVVSRNRVDFGERMAGLAGRKS